MFDCRMGGAIVGLTGTSWASSSFVRLRFASACWYEGPPCTRVGLVGSSSFSGSNTLFVGGFAALGAKWLVAGRLESGISLDGGLEPPSSPLNGAPGTCCLSCCTTLAYHCQLRPATQLLQAYQVISRPLRVPLLILFA